MKPHSHSPEEFGVSPDRMPALIARYLADQDTLNRLHQAPFSALRRERMRGFLAGWWQTLERLPFDTLTQADRVDWLLLRSRMDAELRELEQEERSLASTASLLPFLDSLVALEENRLALSDVDAEAAAETLDCIAARVQELRHSFQNDLQRLCRAAVMEAVRVLARMQLVLKTWFTFYHGYDPLFTWWVEKPYAVLTESLTEYSSFLQNAASGTEEEAILGSPIGRDVLTEELRAAQIVHTPEELIAAGQAEMHWCREELRRAAREMGHGDDWRAALEQVKR